MADEYIEPGTDATLTIRVEQPDGTPRDDAVVTATVYGPRPGTAPFIVDQALAAVGGGTGRYTLAIAAAWSVAGGKYVPGEYLARVTTVRAGKTRVRDFRYAVRFDDDS